MNHTLKKLAFPGLLLAAILYLFVSPPMRYGTYDDDRQCGDPSGTRHILTLTGYLLFTEPIGNTTSLRLGSCPYDQYYAKTYAIELWLLLVAVVAYNYRHGLWLFKSRKAT